MKAFAAIVRRELIATFSSPLAYIVMAAFLLLQGALFALIIGYLSQPGQSSMSILQAFFGGTIFFWFFLVVAPSSSPCSSSISPCGRRHWSMC